MAVGVGEADAVATGDGVGFRPRNTSPATSLSPTQIVIEAFLLAVITKLYSPVSARARYRAR